MYKYLNLFNDNKITLDMSHYYCSFLFIYVVLHFFLKLCWTPFTLAHRVSPYEVSTHLWWGIALLWTWEKAESLWQHTGGFPYTQNSTPLHETQPSWPCSNNTFATAAPFGEPTKDFSDWTIGVYHQSWVPSHPGARLHSCHVGTV